MIRTRVSIDRCRWLILVPMICWIVGPVHASSKKACKRYLEKHVPAIGVLPQVTGLDALAADPDNATLRATTLSMLGYQETESLRTLADRVSAAFESRDACVGDVGKSITVDDVPIRPDDFVALVEALHTHALPVLSEVINERTAGIRAEAERARVRAELEALSQRWDAAIADLAGARADGTTDPASVEELSTALADAESPAARCFARAGLLRIRPLEDGFGDEVREFAGCLDLPSGTTPIEFETAIRDQGFLGVVEARNLALRAGSTAAAISAWTALLDTFGDQPDGAWSEAAGDGIPEDLNRASARAADLGWPIRSRVELGLFCLAEGDTDCLERQFLGGEEGLDVPESLLASIAEDLAEAGDPHVLALWRFLEEHGTQDSRYMEDRVRFAIDRGQREEIGAEVSRAVEAGDCDRAIWILSRAAFGGTEAVAGAERLLPCTERDDAGTAGAAWDVVGDAYRGALRAHMAADPPRLRDAVALARKALEIPADYREPSVTEYARYVLDAADRKASAAAVDTEQILRERFDACTQTLAAIEWKRRREDDSYTVDLESLRSHCCSFLRSNREEWVAWMEAGAEATDARGRVTRREFSAQEIASKRAGLDRYCSGP